MSDTTPFFSLRQQLSAGQHHSRKDEAEKSPPQIGRRPAEEPDTGIQPTRKPPFSRKKRNGTGGESISFGVELRRLRLRAGWKLTDLAEATYYSKSHLSKVETGRKAPSAAPARACDTASVVAQTHSLIRLARGAEPRLAASTLLPASRFAEYGGWMAQEAGDDRAALWWTDHAVELASEAGDQELRAHALIRRACVAMYAHDGLQTVELARQAYASAVSRRTQSAGRPASGGRVRQRRRASGDR